MTTAEFFALYFSFVDKNTESPFVYHRWSLVATVAASLSKRVYVSMGHMTIYPNFYVQLIGSPGIRKSSAIKIPPRLLASAGFDRFGPNTCTKEALVGKLQELGEEITEGDLKTEGLGDDDPLSSFVTSQEAIADLFIVADEFNAFIGRNHEEFLELLSDLWDNHDVYDKWLTSRKTSPISQPYLNIISGNTPMGFKSRFSGASLGQGILTRFIIVPWEEIRQKVAFPEAPSKAISESLVQEFSRLLSLRGEVLKTSEAVEMLGELYNKWVIPTPVHMEQYINRRFTHLLKLCAIFACIECQPDASPTITASIVLQANAMLASNEKNMASTFRHIFEKPDAVNLRYLIVGALKKAGARGLDHSQIHKQVLSVATYAQTATAVDTLVQQGIVVKTGVGKYLIQKVKRDPALDKYLDLSFLTQEEQDVYNRS